MSRYKILTRLCSLAVIVCCLSCSSKPEPMAPYGNQERGLGYFSVNQFIQDQWAIYHGQAFPITRITYLNGEVDSGYTHALALNWGPILQPFIESDISDPDWVGQYTFSHFFDDITQTQNYYYEAKDPDLFTRRLQISVEPFSQKIQSLFIETQETSFWTSRNRKLLYLPLELISIQEEEAHFIGPSKEFRIEFHFQ